MRISVLPGDPGYREDASLFYVLLNDEVTTLHCVIADEAKGLVIHFRDGAVIAGFACMEATHGRVRVVLPTEPRTTWHQHQTRLLS